VSDAGSWALQRWQWPQKPVECCAHVARAVNGCNLTFEQQVAATVAACCLLQCSSSSGSRSSRNLQMSAAGVWPLQCSADCGAATAYHAVQIRPMLPKHICQQLPTSSRQLQLPTWHRSSPVSNHLSLSTVCFSCRWYCCTVCGPRTCAQTKITTRWQPQAAAAAALAEQAAYETQHAMICSLQLKSARLRPAGTSSWTYQNSLCTSSMCWPCGVMHMRGWPPHKMSSAISFAFALPFTAPA
jgi:hypothetical protein